MNTRKLLTTSLVVALLYDSAHAADLALSDVFSKGYPSFSGMEGEKIRLGFEKIAAIDGQKGVSYFDILSAYASKDGEQVRFAMKWLGNKKWPVVLARVEKLTADAVAAGDARAPIFRRAAEKLALQAKDNAIRQDAQAAVAEALKVLEGKK